VMDTGRGNSARESLHYGRFDTGPSLVVSEWVVMRTQK